MAHGTGRGGCYDIALEYKIQSPTSMGTARLWEDENGVSTIKLHRNQGLHVSSIGTNEYWNLKPYFEDLKSYMDPDLVSDPQGFSVNLTYPTSTYDPGPIALNILEVVVGTNTVKLVVESINGNSPNFRNLPANNMPTGICLPHPSGESSDHPVADDENEAEVGYSHGTTEGSQGSSPAVEKYPDMSIYTTANKTLQDVVPTEAMVYTGEPLPITLDMRNIVYKRSSLNEILPHDFKSY